MLEAAAQLLDVSDTLCEYGNCIRWHTAMSAVQNVLQKLAACLLTDAYMHGTRLLQESSSLSRQCSVSLSRLTMFVPHIAQYFAVLTYGRQGMTNRYNYVCVCDSPLVPCRFADVETHAQGRKWASTS